MEQMSADTENSLTGMELRKQLHSMNMDIAPRRPMGLHWVKRKNL